MNALSPRALATRPSGTPWRRPRHGACTSAWNSGSARDATRPPAPTPCPARWSTSRNAAKPISPPTTSSRSRGTNWRPMIRKCSNCWAGCGGIPRRVARPGACPGSRNGNIRDRSGCSRPRRARTCRLAPGWSSSRSWCGCTATSSTFPRPGHRARTSVSRRPRESDWPTRWSIGMPRTAAPASGCVSR